MTPTMSLSRAIQAAMLNRILCPACRWSKVPPSATTGRCVDIELSDGLLERFGLGWGSLTESSLEVSHTVVHPLGIRRLMVTSSLVLDTAYYVYEKGLMQCILSELTAEDGMHPGGDGLG